MADPKDSESFFRKVVRFVANPATDWNDINANRLDEGQELERSELRAMVERKRRNDFVRKRELDTLRKLRRDGLSPEQLAALGGTSKVDDSEVRLSESSIVRADAGVKAKIDEIEQQMVGEGNASSDYASPGRRSGQRPTTAPAGLPVGETPRRERPPAPPPAPRRADAAHAPTEPMALENRPQPPKTLAQKAGPIEGFDRLDLTEPVLPDDMLSRASTVSGEDDEADQLPPIDPLPPLPPLPSAGRSPPSVFGHDDLDDGSLEVSEVVHDPELDEAVIAFANADFAHCEVALEQQRRKGGPRHQHAETWLVLFDLYRAIGQQQKFELLALEYASLFGRSAPQWFSLPKLVADAAAEDRPDTQALKGEVGWICTPTLDLDAVARLRSATLQLPLPWVLDWSAVRRVDADAAGQLTALLRQWAPQRLDMRWLGIDQLLLTLHEAAPTGVRDADPVFWMARLELLRLMNRPDQFDEVAIDYCVTYEVSPPSWEHAHCQVRASSSNAPAAQAMPIVEASTNFPETTSEDVLPAQPVVTVELLGQLSGDISPVLQSLEQRLGPATLVQVSCARLIRVDFIAAGDLLNWVLAKNAEQRSITFTEAHRLVALFFGAMGINEHARVQVPRL